MAENVKFRSQFVTDCTSAFLVYHFSHLKNCPRGPKHVVNKHQLSYVDRICDYLFYKQEHNGCLHYRSSKLELI
jgi:hypothetical protein